MPLAEGEWNLSYSGNGVLPGCDFTFGTFASGVHLLVPYAITYADAETGDVAMPRGDGVRLGEDFRGTATVTFELGVDTVDDSPTLLGRHDRNLEALSRGAEAWDAEALRRRFGAVAVLRTVQGGRARRFYGRPRKWAPVESRLTRQGYTPVVASFLSVDATAYDEVEQTARINLNPPPHRGLVGPLKAPMTMTAASASRYTGEAVVRGTRPAWPVITIVGPISQPVCEAVGRWKVGLDLSIGVGERIVIDPRPWARTVLRGSSSVAGLLTRGSPLLKNVRLPIGRTDLVLRGVDATGTAYMTVAWRDAYGYL